MRDAQRVLGERIEAFDVSLAALKREVAKKEGHNALAKKG
jgi:hypothetical protein